MKLRIKYIAIDPYYSDFEELFVGENADSVDSQKVEFEKYLGRNHANGILSIYKTEILYDNRNLIYGG